MTLSMMGLLAVAGFDLLLLLAIIVNPLLITLSGRIGQLLGVTTLLLFPAVILAIGTGQHLERATSTSFCLSCHTMSDYGDSLFVDDAQFLAASHFQNRLVPNDKACYACHTDYTMFGDVNAKIRGVRHLYVQYLGTIPERMELYGEYQNRECLHCHAGARSFVDNPFHADELVALMGNELSCLTSGCHETTHEVGTIENLERWSPGSASP